jgi:hypothetical protein
MMTSKQEDTAIEAVDTAHLTRMLRDAGYSGAAVTAFQRLPVGGKSHGGGALYRFQLDLASSSEGAPTTLILKTAQQVPSQSQDPSYARRELDCYRADLFAGLGARLLVPRAYAADADADAGRFWIWMEDLGEAFDVAWTPELLAAALRDLAELHAAWWGRAEELARMPFLRWRAQAMYDGLWVAGVSYAEQQAPARLGATAQGLFSGTIYGISAVGTVAGGLIYAAAGPAALFQAAAVVVVVALLVFLGAHAAER